jgi:hypothetical protein
LNNGRDIAASRGDGRRVVELEGGLWNNLIIDKDREGQLRPIVADDIDGPGRLIEALDDAVEVD